MVNWMTAEITYRYKKSRQLLESHPTLLIHNSRVLNQNLVYERITYDQLQATLRKNGLIELSQVRVAVLEENGAISVIPK